VESRDEAMRDRHGESRGEKASPGSELLELGAPKGQQTPKEDGRDRGTAVVRWTKGTTREAEGVLEGERKAMSGK
jgi:hypothetical protein